MSGMRLTFDRAAGDTVLAAPEGGSCHDRFIPMQLRSRYADGFRVFRIEAMTRDVGSFRRRRIAEARPIDRSAEFPRLRLHRGDSAHP